MSNTSPLYLVKNDRVTLAHLDEMADGDESDDFYTTGNKRVDAALGGGVAMGAMYMLSGTPGAGKSTWVMCAIDWVRRYNGIDCLYATAEEDEKMLLRRRRLLNSRPGIYIQGDFEVMTDTTIDVDELITKIKESGAKVVVIDSIQKLSCGKKRGQKSALLAIEKLYALARSEKITFFCICQSTKDGDFSGLQGLQHEVDCHLHYVKGKCHICSTPSNLVVHDESALVGKAHVLKNRFGASGVTF